jgi:SAM-dependent methyltransferase
MPAGGENARPQDSPNVCAGPYGALYDFCIERELLMRLTSMGIWGIDISVLYASMDAISRAADGATILDVPCGGGVAFRALLPDQDLRYIAVDLSERMLARAESRAEERSLNQIEFAVADMSELPLGDGEADLVVSYSGLHMVPDPGSAIREIVRCLKPGGELIGTTFVAEGSRRQRALFAIGGRSGHPVPPPFRALRDRLHDAGIAELEIEPTHGFAVFRGRRSMG